MASGRGQSAARAHNVTGHGGGERGRAVADEIVIHVREPRGTARWIERFLGLFVVVGVGVIGGMLLSGEADKIVFALLWGSLFAGVPAAFIVVQRRHLAQADFVLDRYGVQSSHELPDVLVPWEDVASLRWKSTGTSVNEESLVRVVAVHLDGHETAISSLGLRQTTGEVDDVEAQVRAGMESLGMAGKVSLFGQGWSPTPTDSDLRRVDDDAVVGDAVAEDVTEPATSPSDQLVWPEP